MFEGSIVCVSKYRYHELTSEVQKSFRELFIQDCETLDIVIFKDGVSKDDILIVYLAKLSVSDILKKLNGKVLVFCN